MDRIKFLKKGDQRNFIDLCVFRLNSPSVRGLLQFGFGIHYSTLKNYYNESRLIPKDFFEDLLGVTGISKSELNFEFIFGNWGKIKGGKISRRKRKLR